MSSTSRLPLPLNTSTAIQHSKEHREPPEKNQQLQEEIDSLKQQLEISKRSSQSVGINTSPLPRIPERVPESTTLRHKSTSCSIDFSALEDLLKCSLCQMILLDAVVCRSDFPISSSHLFFHFCCLWFLSSDALMDSVGHVWKLIIANQEWLPLLIPRRFIPFVRFVLEKLPQTAKEILRSPRKVSSIFSVTSPLFLPDQPFYRQYCRSANLDSVVYLLQQTRSSEEMEVRGLDITAFSHPSIALHAKGEGASSDFKKLWDWSTCLAFRRAAVSRRGSWNSWRSSWCLLGDKEISKKDNLWLLWRGGTWKKRMSTRWSEWPKKEIEVRAIPPGERSARIWFVW